MSNTTISIIIDEETNQNAQRAFGKIGIDMTTAINSFLRLVAQEEQIPFELFTKQVYQDEASHAAYINAELDKAKQEAVNPDTKWLSHDDMMARLHKRREARAYV